MTAATYLSKLRSRQRVDEEQDCNRPEKGVKPPFRCIGCGQQLGLLVQSLCGRWPAVKGVCVRAAASALSQDLQHHTHIIGKLKVVGRTAFG